MRVLAITGDTHFKAGNPRFDLQAEAVEHLQALYVGPGALWPFPEGDSYDVVSTQDPFFRGLVGLFLAWRFRAPFNVQVHADISKQSFFKKKIAHFILRHADSVRVVSGATKAYVEGLGVQAPITVLPIFVDSEKFQSVERVPDSIPLVLWVGRFEAEKDPLSAVRVFRDVHARIPNARMVMLGSGSLERSVRQSAEGLPIECPGWQETVPFLARAHVVAVTSLAESWGASIVEALLAGVPVVAPDVGIAREAGARVVERTRLAEALIEVLQTRPSGHLAFQLLSRELWCALWKKSLLPHA